MGDLDNPPPAPLDDEAAKQAEAAAAKAAQEAAEKEQYDAFVKEATNEDGTLKPGYIQDQDGKIVEDPDYKPDENDDDDPNNGDDGSADDIKFWEAVNKLHGVDIPVEYPDGVDSLSPEGVPHRDKHLMALGVKSYVENLKTEDPRLFAYMLHRQSGGTDEEFFSTKSFTLPSYTEFSDNKDMQMSVYKHHLISKGLDEETAAIVVDKALKEEKLFDKADAAYKEIQKQDADVLKEFENRNKEQQQRYKTAVDKTSQTLHTLVKEGKNLNIIIPDAEKDAFQKFIFDSMQYDPETNSIILVQPFGENAEKLVESMYLLYKKGDLKAIIERKAKTNSTLRLGEKMRKANKTGGEPEPRKVQASVPLGQI